MRKFALRIATPQDEASITELLETSYPELMSSSYDAAALVDALAVMTRASPALLASGTYYVAESEDQVTVGCGGWTRERPGTTETEPGLGHVRHFATHPSWIGEGIGRSIYSICEKQARSAGVQRLECYSSLNAVGFYAALGFRPVRRIEVHLSPSVRLPGILMERSV